MVVARRSLLAGVTAAALAVGLSTPARAHRLNAALSVVEVNTRAGTLDVTHRLYAHDLEHAFGLTSVGMDWFASADGVARLGAYCEAMFKVAWGTSGDVALRRVGTEVTGDLVYVYQDAPLATLIPNEGPVEVRIWSGLLHDYSADQRNMVNIRRNGMVATLSFGAGDGPREVTLA